MGINRLEYGQAVQDFRRARQRAGLQQMLARWTGRSLELLSYDQVREQLKAYAHIERGLQQIPMDAIVGSVGRYQDFTRAFLPRHDSDEARWAGVKAAQITQGLPPISVYQIGETYFVQDGNHRVSVARQLGNDTIEAYVTEVKTKVPLSPDDQPDDLILKAEYLDFLEKTKVDELRPNLEVRLTAPGKYPLLLEHIEVHRYYMGNEQGREIPYEEAVTHWLDEVYEPTVRLIQETRLCHDFPDRTSADLYVWMAEHRSELENHLGWEVPAGAVIADLVDQFDTYRPESLVSRALSAVLPASRDRPAELGRWRRERSKTVTERGFTQTLLVPLTGLEQGWQTLDQAIKVAQKENSHIYGLFAVEDQAQAEGILVGTLKGEFSRRCQEAGVQGELIVEEGELERLIDQRGRWADMMVLPAPATSPGGDLTPEPMIRRIIRRAAGPLLVVPGAPSEPESVLLAYDDRPASDEALYVSTYLACQWQLPLTLLHANEDEDAGKEVASKAVDYLSQAGITPELVLTGGNCADALLDTAAERGCDLIVMGSPSLSTLFELVLGSTVKEILERSQIPVLLCR